MSETAGKEDPTRSFAHCHVHTEFSILDGASRIDDLVAAAAADGQPALSITDHGNMYGILPFYAACTKAGITPLLGTEAYMAHDRRDERINIRGTTVDDTGGDVEGGRKAWYHLTLLAESNVGYANLIKLSSRAFLEGYYRKPKCLLPDQEIVTREGTKRIADIRVGDMVMTHRGRFRRVTRTMSREHDGQLSGIKLAGRYGRVTWMTGDHPVLVRSRDGVCSWVRAATVVGGRSVNRVEAASWSSWVCMPKLAGSEATMSSLTVTDYSGPWRPSATRPGCFEKAVARTNIAPTKHYTPFPQTIPLDYDFGYFLGLYVAKGWGNGSDVRWSFHEDEVDLIHHCRIMAEKLTGRSELLRRPDRLGYGGVDVQCGSTLLRQVLISICGSGATNKHLPSIAFTAPREFQQGLVAGVLDGDGSRCPDRTTPARTSRTLAWQMRTLRASLAGDFAHITEFTRHNPAHHTIYESSYAPDGERRRRSRWTREDDAYVYKPVAEVETRRYRGLVYNIEVATDHSYVSDFAIHNCDWDLLADHAEGLVATTGCLGGHVAQSLLAGNFDDALAKAVRLQDIFGKDNLFVELQDHGIEEQHRTTPQLIEIARRIGAPLLATNDSHYTRPEDAQAHDALLCVQTKATIDQPGRFQFKGSGHYLKSAAEMRRLFAELPEACDNTLLIARRAEVRLELGTPKLPDFPVPPEFSTPGEYLSHLTFAGAKQRWGDPVPDHIVERLAYELRVIEDMGFSAYFLIVWDLIRHAKEHGIRVGPGRGSAAGCAVAYCLRITELDPIRYDLLFERFLNPSRLSMPDIDMDFDSRYRDEMIRYAAERYGRDHVAQIITFGTIKARASVRDAARVLGYPYALGDRIAKAMPPLVMGRDTPLWACVAEGPPPGYEDGWRVAAELRQMVADDPDVSRVASVAKGLEGLRRQDGIHAAAVVITKDPLTEYLPVQRKPDPGGDPEDAPIVTQYEMHGVEDLGLLKMDFLGLRNLDVISDTVELIEKTRGEHLDIDHVPLDDEPTFELLRRADSVGVFQLEGGPMRSLLRSLAPTTFEDVAALIALYRPGPMAANMHNDYADRKNRRKEVEYLHPDAERVLSDTFGLMIYQEKLMLVAQQFAGYSLAEADNLRKACLPRGTLFLTEARGYVPIEQIMELSDRRVQTVDTTSAASRFAQVEDVWSVGVKPVFRLTTSTGYSVQATADHRFLVEDRWTRLGDIAAGDLVAVASRTVSDGGSGVTDAEVDLAALLISEGYTPDLTAGPPRAPFFCNTDPELLGAFRTAFERHFGHPSPPAAAIGGVSRVRLTRHELLSLRPLLGSLGRSADKTISPRLINASTRKVERFLGLYFCADGWADPSGAHFGSKSEQVCRALKRMLLRCGIVAIVRRRETAEHGTHYTLSITDKGQAKAFAQLVGPHLTAVKSAKVGRWLTEWGVGASATNIGIPSSFLRAELERRCAVTGRSKRQLGIDAGGHTSVRVLHRRTLDGLLCSERLEDLRTGDLVWDTVVAVEPVGERECFDFQMADPDRPYALAEDVLVHNCGKKIREVMRKERDKFVESCVRKGYPKEIGEKWFDIIEPFADYAFPKAHAFGYGFIAYQTAYLKANYPTEYFAALLTSVRENLDRAGVYLAECRALGITVSVPDVNRSTADFTPVVGEGPGKGTILFGLAAVRNVGTSVAEAIVAEREARGPFASFVDFCERVPIACLNKQPQDALIRAGAFDSLGHTRKGLLHVHELIVSQIVARRREREQGVLSLFGDADGRAPAFDQPVEIPDAEFDKKERLAHEKEMLGLYVSDHPLLGLQAALRRRSDGSLTEVTELPEGTTRTFAGVITGLQVKWTKRGEQMAVFTLEDLESSIEVTVFPKTMVQYSGVIADDSVVTVRARIDKRDEQPKLIASEIAAFAGGPVSSSGPLRVRLPMGSMSVSVLDSLKEVLAAHHGDVPVHLYLGGPGSKGFRLPPEYCVDTSNGVIAALRVSVPGIEILPEAPAASAVGA